MNEWINGFQVVSIIKLPRHGVRIKYFTSLVKNILTYPRVVWPPTVPVSDTEMRAGTGENFSLLHWWQNCNFHSDPPWVRGCGWWTCWNYHCIQTIHSSADIFLTFIQSIPEQTNMLGWSQILLIFQKNKNKNKKCNFLLIAWGDLATAITQARDPTISH